MKMHRVCSFRAFCSVRVLIWLISLTLLAIFAFILFHDGGPFQQKIHGHQTSFDKVERNRESWYRVTPSNTTEGSEFSSIGSEEEASDLLGVSLQEHNPLTFIPRVPKFSTSDFVPFYTANITRKYLTLPKKVYTDTIVILSPVCDEAGLLERFASQVSALSYPHDLISVYFGEDSSSDNTFEVAARVAADLKSKFGFRDARAFTLNISGGIHGSRQFKHRPSHQYVRRSHMAKARNLLLNTGLRDEKWVLWIDSDVAYLPRDLIQQLIFAGQDVTTVPCLIRSGPYKKNYDKNSWRETKYSLAEIRQLPPGTLLVEGGPAVSKRLSLTDLAAEGRVVPLDGVGGCTLFVNATCHRLGLHFPEEIFQNRIETEGLAKLAKHMGFSVAGMPFVEVYHNQW